MNYRILGKTGFRISEVGLGTWQVGGKWDNHLILTMLIKF